MSQLRPPALECVMLFSTRRTGKITEGGPRRAPYSIRQESRD